MPFSYGQDPGAVVPWPYAMRSRCGSLGYPDQRLEWSHEALALAQ